MTTHRKRPHEKVRTGCTRCKSKRIKCDERKPQCSHCERHREPCKYAHIRAPSASMSPDDRLLDHRSPQSTTGSVSSSVAPVSTITIELMHNWTLHAWKGFGDMPHDRKVWQEDIANMSFAYPWLLDSLFAVSALHLAKYRPEKRQLFLDQADSHMQLALAPYRTIMNDPCHLVTPETVHACVACAALTVAYGFARPQIQRLQSNIEPTKWPGIPEWFALLLGPRHGLRPIQSWIVNGPMAYQLRNLDDVTDVYTNRYESKLSKLEQLYRRPSSDAATNEVNEICQLGLDSLRIAFKAAYDPIPQIGYKLALYDWTVRVPPRLHDLFHEARPEALMLLAHLYVLVKDSARSYWYMEGAAENMIRLIETVLEPDWMLWMEWPRQYILAR